MSGSDAIDAAAATGGACEAGPDGTVTSQFGNPRGLLGRLALAAMAVKNGAYNRAARDALALETGDKVLEIGCGPGVSLRKVSRRVGRTGFVGGVDHAPAAVRAALARNLRAVRRGRASVMQASAEKLPFEDGFFDKAYAVNSFQFWPQPEAGLAEIARVLKPGGRLVIVQRSAGDDTDSNFAGAQGGWDRIEKAVQAGKAAGFRVLDVTQEPAGKLVAAIAIMQLDR